MLPQGPGAHVLLARASRLVRRLVASAPIPREFDFLSGTAGAIVALLALSQMLEEESLLSVALKLGDTLVESAEKAEIGYSWRSLLGRSRRNLTGFAHGTAGVAFALMELFRMTRGSRFREAAEESKIGWAIWDWKAGFHYWNEKTGRPEPGMRQALFGKAQAGSPR